MMAAMTIRDREMTLIEHLAELRNRVFIAGIAVLATTVFSFFFAEWLIRVLLLPAETSCQLQFGGPDQLVQYVCEKRADIKLQTLSPTEGFTTYMRVALFGGITLAMPVILYQLYRYIDPALLPQERRWAWRMGVPVILLFILGILFCYFVLLPPALNFLTSFGSAVFTNNLRAAEYLSFVTTFLLGMGVVFEMPALIYALVKVRVVRRDWLARQRRYVFLIVFVIAAIITPTPDPFNQTLVALPLYVLFELGLFLSRFA